MAHEAACWLYQNLGRHEKAISGVLLQRQYGGSNADSPRHKAEEKKVHQSFCGEISEYGTPLPKWHIPVHTGGSVPLQLTECTDRGKIAHEKCMF